MKNIHDNIFKYIKSFGSAKEQQSCQCFYQIPSSLL